MTTTLSPEICAAMEMQLRIRDIPELPFGLSIDGTPTTADFTTPMYLNHVAALEWWICTHWGIA